MPIHDWTRVNAGTFHDFHSGWIIHLRDALNSGILPRGYYAMAEQHAGEIIPDVLTLSPSRPPVPEMPPGRLLAVAEAPPRVSVEMRPEPNATYVRARRTLAIRHTSGHRVVAMIEIVSPANKDRSATVRDFVHKAVSALQREIHLLVVDLFPPGRSTPTASTARSGTTCTGGLTTCPRTSR